MTRDLNLLRRLLLAVDAIEGPVSTTDLLPEIERSVLLYHARMLQEAGYVDLIDNCTTRERRYTIHGLTWKGQEFLSAIRPEARWQQIKDRLQIDARAVPVYVVEQYAFQLSVHDAPVEALSTK